MTAWCNKWLPGNVIVVNGVFVSIESNVKIYVRQAEFVDKNSLSSLLFSMKAVTSLCVRTGCDLNPLLI